MKKLLLILLCLPLFIYPQSDNSFLADGFGEYFTTKGNPKLEGIDFKIKIPLGYKSIGEGKKEETIQMYSSSGETTFLLIQAIDLRKYPKYESILQLNNAERKLNIEKSTINHQRNYPKETLIYLEVNDYPATIGLAWSIEQQMSHLIGGITTENYVINFIFSSKFFLQKKDVEFCKEMLNTIEFY